MKTSFVVFASLLACVGCFAPSASRPVEQNFVVSDMLDDGLIKGRYAQSGFSQAQVKKMITDVVCRPGAGLATFSESSIDGQIVFDATCQSGPRFGRGSGANFERVAPGTVKYWALYELNGDLVQEKGDLQM